MIDQNLSVTLAEATKQHLQQLLREHGLLMPRRDLESLADVVFWALKASSTPPKK